MGFKIFEKGSHINSGLNFDELRVGKSTVTLGGKATKFLDKGFVEVYLDREANLVGFKPSDNGLKGFRVQRKEGQKHNAIASCAFIKLLPKGSYKTAIEDGYLTFQVSEIAKPNYEQQ